MNYVLRPASLCRMNTGFRGSVGTYRSERRYRIWLGHGLPGPVRLSSSACADFVTARNAGALRAEAVSPTSGADIRYITATTAALTLAVVVTPSAVGASVSTLHHRAHRQQAHLHAVVGTVRFFTNHPKQARTVVGRRETRRARVWITVLKRELAETVASLRTLNRDFMSVPQIICAVFGAACSKALQVFGCESRYSVSARNGQYFGIGQMGSAERARFGGSSLDPWEQVRAAYAYYRVAGWSPWQCA